MWRLIKIFLFFPILIYGQFISDSSLTCQIIKSKNPSNTAIFQLNKIDSFRYSYEKKLMSGGSVQLNGKELPEFFEYINSLLIGNNELIVKQYAALNLPFISYQGIKVSSELLNQGYEILPPNDEMWGVGNINMSILTYINAKTNYYSEQYLKSKNLTFSQLNQTEKNDYWTFTLQKGIELRQTLYKENPIILVKAYALISIIDLLDTFKMGDLIKDYYGELVSNYSQVKNKFIEEAIKEYSPKSAMKIGKQFPQFSHKDIITNKLVSLSNLKGKYCLIHFWATWCGNCIAEIPTLMKVYEKFKNSNFEIISFSLDRNISDATKYIKDNKVLPWHNVFVEKVFNSDLAIELGLHELPRLILIDKNGIILDNDVQISSITNIIEESIRSH